MERLTIRRAVTADAPEISRLIVSVAHYFTVHPQGEGAEAFFASVSPEQIARYIENPGFLYFVALSGERPAGVTAIRDGNHLVHLFVAPEFQRQGIGSALWQRAKSEAIAAGNPAGFTVNSTPFAVPFYQRLGFTPTGPQVEQNGIRFIPMKLDRRD